MGRGWTLDRDGGGQGGRKDYWGQGALAGGGRVGDKGPRLHFGWVVIPICTLVHTTIPHLKGPVPGNSSAGS